MLIIDNYDINVGAIYYPVADLYNPPPVYPTDDYHYSAYGYGGGNPTGTPSSMPTVHARRRKLSTDDLVTPPSNDDTAQAGSKC